MKGNNSNRESTRAQAHGLYRHPEFGSTLRFHDKHRNATD